MNRRVLIDTNILIDAAVPGRPQHQAAQTLEDGIACGAVASHVCATSLKDVYFLVKQATDEAFAREYVQCLLKLHTLVGVDAPVCEIAAYSDEPDFEDGIIRACAESIGVDYIISRDEDAFKKSPIKRLSAQEYVETYVEEEIVPYYV